MVDGPAITNNSSSITTSTSPDSGIKGNIGTNRSQIDSYRAEIASSANPSSLHPFMTATTPATGPVNTPLFGASHPYMSATTPFGTAFSPFSISALQGLPPSTGANADPFSLAPLMAINRYSTGVKQESLDPNLSKTLSKENNARIDGMRDMIARLTSEEMKRQLEKAGWNAETISAFQNHYAKVGENLENKIKDFNKAFQHDSAIVKEKDGTVKVGQAQQDYYNKRFSERFDQLRQGMLGENVVDEGAARQNGIYLPSPELKALLAKAYMVVINAEKQMASFELAKKAFGPTPVAGANTVIGDTEYMVGKDGTIYFHNTKADNNLFVSTKNSEEIALKTKKGLISVTPIDDDGRIIYQGTEDKRFYTDKGTPATFIV